MVPMEKMKGDVDCHPATRSAVISEFAVFAPDFTEEWGFGILAAKPTQTSG